MGRSCFIECGDASERETTSSVDEEKQANVVYGVRSGGESLGMNAVCIFDSGQHVGQVG